MMPLILTAAVEGIVPDRMDPVIIVLAGFTSLGTALMLLFSIFDRMSGKTKERTIQQPLHTVTEEKPMTVPMHEAACSPLHHRVGALESDVRMIRLKMDADKNEIISSGEERAVAIHNRINVAIEKLGELKGQVTEVAKRVK